MLTIEHNISPQVAFGFVYLSLIQSKWYNENGKRVPLKNGFIT